MLDKDLYFMKKVQKDWQKNVQEFRQVIKEVGLCTNPFLDDNDGKLYYRYFKIKMQTFGM